MSVAFDALTSAYTDSTGTTLTISNLTVGAGSNRAITLHLQCGSQGTAFPAGLTVVRDPTGDNQAFTQVPGTLGVSGNITCVSAIYALLAPTSAGNKNIVISWTGANEMHACAASWTGVDQTSVAVAFPNGTTHVVTSAASPCTVTITSAAGNMVTANHAQNVNVWNTISDNPIGGASGDTSGPNLAVSANYKAGAATATLTASFTGTGGQISVGCDILAASGGAALPPGQQSFSTPQPDRDTSKFPPQLRSWTAPDRQILIGQDKFPPGAQSYDRTPDPKDAFSLWRSYVDNFPLTLIGQDKLPPGRQTNYLPERSSWRPESPQQNLSNTLLSAGPPLPPGKQLYARGVDPLDAFAQWRSWAQSRNPNLAGQDRLPPGVASYALSPFGPQRGVDFQPTVNIALLTQVVVGLPPGAQLYSRSVDPIDSFTQWRAWAWFSRNLVGQDRLPPGRQFWESPRSPLRGLSFQPPNLIPLLTFVPPAIPPGKQFFSLPPLGSPPVVPSWSLFNINLFPPPFVPPPLTFPATYYLLQDLYINEHYLPAGTIQTTQDLGGVLPVNWVPNPNVDPVDANAVAAYTAAGYTRRGLSRQRYSVLPVAPANYVWQQINGVWTLVKVANFPRSLG